MRIAIIGGHGKIALLLAPQLVARGDDVLSVVRNPVHRDDVAATGATPYVADVEALDTEGLVDLVRGLDAVVWSAGAGGGDPRRTMAVDRDAAMRAIDAAERAGVSRFVMVSYFGAGPDHGVPPDNPFHTYAEAKAAADEHLRASGLDWTILGPSTLTDEPATGCIDVDAGAASSVGRADVAAVIAEVIGRADTHRRTLAFNNGAVAIERAVAPTGTT